MKKILFLIFTLLGVCLSSKADANWRMHVTFDENVNHVIETPHYVYFTSQTLPESSRLDPLFSLFRYDKAGDELLPLSTDNFLVYNTIKEIQYNPEKGYLVVVYTNFDIDLLHDNGDVTNIPYYRLDNLALSKKVNAINVDPENDRVYLATDFGYVALNDKKAEIAESRIYNEALVSFCRIGDYYYAMHGSDLLKAPVSSPRLTLEDYEKIAEFENPTALYPLKPDHLLIVENGKVSNLFSLADNSTVRKIDGTVFNVENNSKGLLVSGDSKIYQYSQNGSVSSVDRPEGYESSAAGTLNGSEYWFGKARKGLASGKTDNSSWTLTRDYMKPNSPSPFLCTEFRSHPDLGLMALTYGYVGHIFIYPHNIPLLLNSYKNGRWKELSPVYENPAYSSMMTNPNGFAIDPDNKNFVYATSYSRGILRLNLENPNDFLHLSYEGDPSSKFDGFYAFMPTPQKLKDFCNFSAPYFDKKGNMWMFHADWDDQDPPMVHLYCWTAEDRRASTSASSVRPPQLLKVNTGGYDVCNYSMVLPINNTGSGLLLFLRRLWTENITIIDTNDTPLDDSDDKVYVFNEFIDRDGNNFVPHTGRCAWEDPYTGYIWIGHNEGVFYFDPKQVIAGNYQVTRPKVSRNDGTNLADYLLDGVPVNGITTDSSGRKWFATEGGGVVCTSSDGREILMEFNTDNSDLPSDNTFGIGYKSDSNSMLISTDEGLAEYFLPSNQENSDVKADIRAYPNPVRPEYTGYVTLTDIPQGSLVKIVDSGGNLVKELGRMSGFEMKWDISDINFRRVSSGVYFIMVSPGDESGSFSAVGKILVVS